MSRSARYVVLLVGAVLLAVLPVCGGVSANALTTPTAAARVTARPHLPVRTLSVAAPWAMPGRPILGQRLVLGGQMPGHVRRPVVLIIDGARRAFGRTDRRGHYRFAVRAPARVTTLRVKVSAPRLGRHRPALTAIRLIPVVIQVQPCTALPAGITIWTAGSQRRVNCLLTVPAGSALKIAAGATVLFGKGSGILVKGSLVVAGTAAKPVRLKAATANRWAGVSTAGDPAVDITHAVMTGAQTAIDEESDTADPKGHLRVTHSRIHRCGTGVLVQSSISTVWTLSVSVTDTDFGGLARGVWIERATDPVVARNSVHGVSGVPVTVMWSGIDLNLIHDNSGYANTENVWVTESNLVVSEGTLVGGRAEQALGTPEEPRPLMPLLHSGGLVIDRGTTVTIAPGVIKADGGGIVSYGALDIAGTAGSPVVLTSAKDGSVGDRAALEEGAAPGDWVGVQVAGAGGSVDGRHLLLSYASTAVSQGSSDSGVISIADSTFTHNANGIESQAAPLTVERSTFVDGWRGVDMTGARHPVVRDNSFSGLTSVPIAVADSTVDVDDVSGNVVTDSLNRSLALYNVTIDADGAWPMGPADWNSGASAPASGHSVPLTTILEATDTIAAGVTVTFGPGAVKFRGGGLLDVKGSAVLTGTNTQPAVLTSETDGHVGVPVGDPSASVSTGLVRVEAGAHFLAESVVFRDTGQAVSMAPGAEATMNHVEFAGTTQAVDAGGTSGCAAPFGMTAVTGTDVWFGASGGPGGLVALGSVTDPGSGDASYAQARSAYDDAVARYGSLDSSVTDNAIPFADWACAGYSFPVTPVLVDVAPSAPYPDYAQTP